MKVSSCLHRAFHSQFFKNIYKVLRGTSLQGLKYVFDSNLSYGTRTFFGLTLSVTIFLAINFAVNVFDKWKSTPVLIGRTSTLTSIKDIPFPAITICNMNKVKRSQVKYFRKESSAYAMLQKACFNKMDFSIYQHLKSASEDDSFSNFLLTNSPSCNEMIIRCTFGGRTSPCSNFFREILVDEGLCCVFNLMHPYYIYKYDTPDITDSVSMKSLSGIPINWSNILGYPKDLPNKYYPYRGIGAGVEMGMQMVLNGDIDNYYCSSTNGPGFKVISSYFLIYKHNET